MQQTPSFKGVQLEVLGEGRYFRNPFTWDWHITAITDIPAGCFGVLVRKYGQDLPEGQIVAPGPEYRGNGVCTLHNRIQHIAIALW